MRQSPCIDIPATESLQVRPLSGFTVMAVDGRWKLVTCTMHYVVSLAVKTNSNKYNNTSQRPHTSAKENIWSGSGVRIRTVEVEMVTDSESGLWIQITSKM